MNYMKMVSFLDVSPNATLAEMRFSEREEFFRNHYPFRKIVPPYVILEAIFQTAGRMVRAHTSDRFAGIIASFSQFEFTRPLLAEETLTLKATLKSAGEKSCMVQVSVHRQNEVILEAGKLMLMYEHSIVSSHLNNALSSDIENQRNYFLGERA